MKGDQLSEGNVDIHELYEHKGSLEVARYIVNEVQKIYHVRRRVDQQQAYRNDRPPDVLAREDHGRRRRAGFRDGRSRREGEVPRSEQARSRKKAARRRKPTRCCSASRASRSPPNHSCPPHRSRIRPACSSKPPSNPRSTSCAA